MLRVVEKPSKENQELRETLDEVLQRGALKMLQEVFVAEYDAKYPKAVASLRRDQAQLLTFYEFPAEHWRHLRTTNIIESPFATVRWRTRVTKGAGSRTKALMMAFKLLAMAEERWRKVNGSELPSLMVIRTGITANPQLPPNPSMADLYRSKVEELAAALQREDTRLEASEMLRGLIDSIVLIPDEGQLRIELRGNLAAMLTAAQQTKRSPETGDLLVPVQLVAGARNPLNLEFAWAAA